MSPDTKHSQRTLPPMLLAKETQPDPVRPNDTLPDRASALAADLFDQALRGAGMTSDEAAYLLGISTSLVNRMRNQDARERVSLVQLLRCGPVVTWHFHVALHHKEQFGQRALRQAMQSLSLMAVGTE